MARFTEEEAVLATRANRVRSGKRGVFDEVCTDTRALVPGCLFVALQGERFDGHDFLSEAAAHGAAGAIVQKGRVPSWPADGFALLEVESTLRALGDLARFHRRRFRMPVGAITGSSGKTTTKEMVHAILSLRGAALKTEGNLNNEVGVPLTLFRLTSSHVAAVVEMGMSHEGEIARLTSMAEPEAGLITAIQPAHLQGLGTLDRVAAAKGELFRGLKRGATAVVNSDDPRVSALPRAEGASVLTFGEAPDAQVRVKSLEQRPPRGLAVVLEYSGRDHPVLLSFLGRHNARNAAGAFALAVALGYRPEECARGLELAKPYPGRLTALEAPGGITVLDDTYNANPASMAAALEALREFVARNSISRAVAVVGDMLELGSHEAGEHARLGEQVAAVAELAAFFGPRSLAAHQAAGMGERGAHFEDVSSLVQWLKPRLRPRDAVLVKASRGMRLERVVQQLIGAGISAEAH